jgi:hypothetical protein
MFQAAVTDKIDIYIYIYWLSENYKHYLKGTWHISMENKRDMEAVVKSRKEKEQRAVPQPVNKGQLSYKR